METIYFSYCWGVFDGGGVRGLLMPAHTTLQEMQV